MSLPSLSVIVGTVDRPDGIRRLVSSVCSHTHLHWEMLIADASSMPIPLPSVRNINVIRESPRLGHVKGYNAAFRMATGKWVIWLNDDAEVEPLWADYAIGFMERNPNIGLGCIPYSENGCPAKVQTYLGMNFANFGILSRELGNKIGWFDEDIRMYGADNSLTFRVLMQGKGVGVVHRNHLIKHHVVRDRVRDQNEAGQAVDNQKLMRNYHQHLSAMKRTYDFHLPLIKS